MCVWSLHLFPWTTEWSLSEDQSYTRQRVISNQVFNTKRVKCSSQKHEGQSSTSKTHTEEEEEEQEEQEGEGEEQEGEGEQEEQEGVVKICNPSTGKVETGGSLGAHWPANPANCELQSHWETLLQIR